MSTNLYPVIEDAVKTREEENKRFDFTETLKLQCNDNISKMRCEIIMTKYKDLEKLNIHYNKLMKRWSKVSNILRISGITMASLFGAAGLTIGTLASAGTIIPVIIPVILSASTIIDEAVCECILRTYAKRKKHYFNIKREIIKKYLDRLHHLVQKVIEDGIISLGELESFYALVDAFDQEMNNIKNTENNNESVNINEKKLDVRAAKLAKKEYETELLEQMKNEKKEAMKKN